VTWVIAGTSLDSSPVDWRPVRAVGRDDEPNATFLLNSYVAPMTFWDLV
jgi:hypothetical protein